MTLKALILSIFTSIVLSSTYAQDFFYDAGQQAITNSQQTEHVGTFVGEESTDTNSLLNSLIRIFRLDPFTAGGTNPNAATNYVAFIINILLSLAALIALAYLIYGFYLMFFAKQEEGFDKAKKIVIGTSAALFLIAIARFLIAFIFSIFDRLK